MKCVKCGAVLDETNKMMFVNVSDKGSMVSQSCYCRYCRQPYGVLAKVK